MKRNRIIYLIAILLLVHSCTSPLKSYHNALKKGPYDVIIVPGIPYEQQNWASNVMRDRVVWSCFLYSRGIARHIIYSGDAVYSPYVEGKIMALHALALGIPRSVVFSETKAEHSTENLIYSYRMAKKMGFEKIAVATDPFQSNTLKSFAWDYYIPVTFVPILYDSLSTILVDSAFHIDPSSAFVNDFIPLPKRVNIVKRIVGTLGLEVRDDESE
jgi:uncharacterized SAM-binding protein YcdF (DUF218 family)